MHLNRHQLLLNGINQMHQNDGEMASHSSDTNQLNHLNNRNNNSNINNSISNNNNNNNDSNNNENDNNMNRNNGNNSNTNSDHNDLINVKINSNDGNNLNSNNIDSINRIRRHLTGNANRYMLDDDDPDDLNGGVVVINGNSIDFNHDHHDQANAFDHHQINDVLDDINDDTIDERNDIFLTAAHQHVFNRSLRDLKTTKLLNCINYEQNYSHNQLRSHTNRQESISDHDDDLNDIEQHFDRDNLSRIGDKYSKNAQISTHSENSRNKNGIGVLADRHLLLL